MSLALTQPPSHVAVVSGDEVDQEMSGLKVKVRSQVPKKPAKSSGRRAQVKIPPPPAGSAAEDKEVRATPSKAHWFFILFMKHYVYYRLVYPEIAFLCSD